MCAIHNGEVQNIRKTLSRGDYFRNCIVKVNRSRAFEEAIIFVSTKLKFVVIGNRYDSLTARSLLTQYVTSDWKIWVVDQVGDIFRISIFSEKYSDKY